MPETPDKKPEDEQPGGGAKDAAPPEKPAAAAKTKPKPRLKPKVKVAWEAKNLHRRDWLLVAGWVSFAFANVVGLTFYLGRFFFPNVTYEPPLQFKAGPPTDLSPGRVDERFKETNGTWLVRDDLGVYALSTVCTHLGCTPNWLESEQKFKCPCHGSGFRKTGVNFEGPAPRPLERYRIVQSDDGQILVDKSVKFQAEKGEWTKPEAFLYV